MPDALFLRIDAEARRSTIVRARRHVFSGHSFSADANGRTGLDRDKERIIARVTDERFTAAWFAGRKLGLKPIERLQFLDRDRVLAAMRSPATPLRHWTLVLYGPPEKRDAD